MSTYSNRLQPAMVQCW